jgi:hypothetical protein
LRGLARRRRWPMLTHYDSHRLPGMLLFSAAATSVARPAQQADLGHAEPVCWPALPARRRRGSVDSIPMKRPVSRPRSLRGPPAYHAEPDVHSANSPAGHGAKPAGDGSSGTAAGFQIAGDAPDFHSPTAA